MATDNFKPGSGRFASGNKFKGRGAATGNFNSDKSSRDSRPEHGPRNQADRPDGDRNGTRPFRDDRTAKFRDEGKKVYNRSERFNRSGEEGAARPSGERGRSFESKRPAFKGGAKFSKPAPFQGRRNGDTDQQTDRPAFNRERADRPERSDRSERRDRPNRSEDNDRNDGNRSSDRPRYSDRRSAGSGYAAKDDRRAAPAGDRKPYASKPYGQKAFGADDRRDKATFDKPRYDKGRGSENDRGRGFGSASEEKSGFDRSRTTGFNRKSEDRPARPYNRFAGDKTSKAPFNEKRTFDRDRSGDEQRPAISRDAKSFDRSRTYDDRRAERGSKRNFRTGSEKPAEAPDYDLKRYQARERREADKQEENGLVRLNRYIANAGICSRREADNLIASGEIKVNGEPVTEMGYMVRPEDTVTYGKKRLNREKMVYVLLNKPKDFITTTEDPEGRKTVMDLVSNASKERIFPVGRLDRNTTGLLLFTNDGELAQKLTHPSNNISKIYQVELNTPITEEHFKMIAAGLELEDGKADVDDLAIIGNGNTFLGIQIHIGKNRIVRRIFEHLGYEVVALDRVQYAGLTKKDLSRGKWRFLDEKEVIRLKYFL